jgi:hypothetical protein
LLRHEAAHDSVEGNDRRKDDDGYLSFEPHLELLNRLRADTILTRLKYRAQGCARSRIST